MTRLVTAIAVGGVALLLAFSAPATAKVRADGASNIEQTDFSAQRRYWRGRHWAYRGGYWRGRHWGWRGRYWAPRYAWGPRYRYWGPRYAWGPRWGYARPWRYSYYRPWGYRAWGYRPWRYGYYRPYPYWRSSYAFAGPRFGIGFWGGPRFGFWF